MKKVLIIGIISFFILLTFGLVLAFAVSPEDSGNKPPIDSSGGSQTSPDDPSAEKPKYIIQYDQLGSGSVDSFIFHCVSEAAAGEEVRFTIEVLDDELKVVNLMIECDEEGEYDYDYTVNKDGSYSFVMPNNYVTVIIYLMPK